MSMPGGQTPQNLTGKFNNTCSVLLKLPSKIAFFFTLRPVRHSLMFLVCLLTHCITDDLFVSLKAKSVPTLFVSFGKVKC